MSKEKEEIEPVVLDIQSTVIGIDMKTGKVVIKDKEAKENGEKSS